MRPRLTIIVPICILASFTHRIFMPCVAPLRCSCRESTVDPFAVVAISFALHTPYNYPNKLKQLFGVDRAIYKLRGRS